MNLLNNNMIIILEALSTQEGAGGNFIATCSLTLVSGEFVIKCA